MMSQEVDPHEEVAVFEANAKEGLRAVIFTWAFDRIIMPLIIFAVVCVAAAWYNNGLLAGILSMLFFAAPIVCLSVFSAGQFRKIFGYFLSPTIKTKKGR